MNSPKEIATGYIAAAKTKTTLVFYKTLILGVLAGVFIALAGALATAAGSGFSGMQSTLIKAAVFPLGLILVVTCGAELFTGNSLLIAPLLNRDIKATGMIKNWGLAYLGNFIGATFIAVLVVFGKVYGDAASAAAVTVVANKCAANFGHAFLRGILCNMLVCLAVWAAMSSKSSAGKVLAVYLPVFAFVVCGFEHSIANMYYIMSALMIEGNGLNFGYALLNGLLAPTLGNIVGGALIAVAYWAVYFRKDKIVE